MKNLLLSLLLIFSFTAWADLPDGAEVIYGQPGDSGSQQAQSANCDGVCQANGMQSCGAIPASSADQTSVSETMGGSAATAVKCICVPKEKRCS